jgi:hypothetical protein
MSTKKLTIIWIIIAIAALVGGFLWGKSAAAGSVTAAGRTGAGRFALGSSTTGFAGRGGFGGAAGAGGAGLATGQVLSVSGDSLTLQLANGNSENIFFSSSTQVIVPQPAPLSTIQSGTMVMVEGTTNSDGSVTASTIEVRNTTGGNTSAQ